MYTFICEDSISGVFSGIYEAWAGKYNRNEIRIKAGGIDNYELFMEYKQIKNTIQWSQKVANTIRKRFGEETYQQICYALWSSGEDKADAVYQMIRYGIENHCGYELQNHLTNPSIQRVFELFRATNNEAHHYLGFLRFVQLDTGVLYAKIRPRNYVLEPLSVHFADRIPGENWIIHDSVRRIVAIHPALEDWFISDAKSVDKVMETVRGRVSTDVEAVL